MFHSSSRQARLFLAAEEHGVQNTDGMRGGKAIIIIAVTGHTTVEEGALVGSLPAAVFKMGISLTEPITTGIVT